jgi:hypothetical protein
MTCKCPVYIYGVCPDLCVYQSNYMQRVQKYHTELKTSQ